METAASVLFFDGAFGTYYYQKTSDDTPCELACRTNPQLVEQIHREYIQAGAQAIKANTYAANSLLGPRDDVFALITEAWRIASRAAAGTQTAVFADIGYIPLEPEAAREEYLALARHFLSLGAKNFLFETLAEFSPILPAVLEIRRLCPQACIIASFAVSQDGYTKKGYDYRSLLSQVRDTPQVDAGGLNCLCGPSHMLALIKKLGPMAASLSVMPNSGYPSTINGRTVYRDNADYFSDKLVQLYETGVRFLGGCCGSTPRHISLAIQKIKALPAPRAVSLQADKLPAAAQPQAQPMRKSPRKLIAAELDPPVDTDFSFLLGAARLYRDAGAHYITVADSPLSRTRADSLMTAAKIQREVGICTLPHISCRDKNIIALKAGLLGASMEGIRQVLVVTGDPVSKAQRSSASSVFEFNSFELIAYINTLNEDVFAHAPFSIAGALNVNAANFPQELARARRKVENGASLLLTQPIFSQAAIENFKSAKAQLPCKLLAGILPVASWRNAMFLLNEVSGIEIPQSVLDSLEGQPPQVVMERSAAYSMQLIDQLYDTADGFYLMTPLKKTALVQRLILEIRRREDGPSA